MARRVQYKTQGIVPGLHGHGLTPDSKPGERFRFRSRFLTHMMSIQAFGRFSVRFERNRGGWQFWAFMSEYKPSQLTLEELNA